MNIYELTINWQNFARVRLQLKFAFIIQPSCRLHANLPEWLCSNL